MDKSAYYFAYGSNLSKKQMKERCPDSKVVSVATLHNFKLIFTGWARRWRGGTASIKSWRGEKVAGALYELSERDWKLLDGHEGYPETANKIKVKVTNAFDELIEAITYVKVGQLEETPPSKEYLSVMQQGYQDWGIGVE